MCAPGRRSRRRTRISRRSADPQSFAAMTRRAIAHGRPAEAEALAKQRPATDGAAAGVLGQLAAARGQYDEAIAILEPAATREPGSEAALQLGLIELQLGRAQLATRRLTEVLQQGAAGRDGEGLFRGARAAQALGRPRDANSLFKAADCGFGGPRHRRRLGPAVPREVQQAGGAPLAAGGAEARPGVGARARRAGARARRREPAGRRRLGAQGARDRQGPRRRPAAPRRARSQQLEARRRAR